MKDNTIELMLNLLNEKFEVQELDVKEFKNLKVGPMKLKVSQYYIKGIGNLSIMTGKAMMGLMKMDTLILSAFEVDAPIFSYDRIHAMGNDTLIYDLYDSYVNKSDISSLQKVVDKYQDIPDKDPGVHWYDDIRLPEATQKKAKGKGSARIQELTIEYFKEFLNLLSTFKPTDPEVKKPLVDKYTQGLLDNGGASTDMFLEKLGKEKTTELFKEVLFATK